MASLHGTLQKDDNGYPVAGGVSSTNPLLVLNAKIDPSTGRLLVNNGGGGSGSITVTDGVTTVTSVTTLDFTSGATVTNPGGGTANVAITAGGSGTVTSVSVTPANGVSGTVATATTTPAITLTLGAITPSAVNVSGLTLSSAVATDASKNLVSVANTGSGNNVLATSPTLVTPTLGVATATSVNKVALTAPATGSTLTVADGKTLTSSNTLTLTGTDGSSVAFGAGGTVLYGNQSITLSSDVTGSGTTAITTTVAKIAGTTVSGTTGSGNVVFSTSPTMVTPTLGVASATTINKVTLTAPATGSTLTVADGKTLTASNSLTLAGTDSTVMTFPGTSQTIVGLTATQTITNKRVTRRVVVTTQSATPTINTDNTDVASITGLAQAITSMTTNLSGTPNLGDFLEVQITDNGTARGITWGTSFVSSTVILPTTTVISTLLHVLFEWDSASSKWICVSTA